MEKMNPELKAKWVAELRSGVHKQCTGVLTDNGAYCCLGVLHKLMTGEEPPRRWDMNEPDHGLEYDQVGRLVDLNDGRDGERVHSFAEIADHIEKNL